MPNIKSAKKRVLVNQAKAAQNKAAKSALKTDIKKFEAAVAEGSRSEADSAYKVAVKAVDKAAAKGLLHKNNAANKKSSMTIETANPAAFQKGGAYLARFAFATDVALTEKYTGTTDGVVTVVTPAARGFIPMMELIDREKELKRLHKELEKAEKEANMFRNQLNNPKFVERAPEKLVNETRTKLAASEDKIANINQSIQALG